MLNFCPREGGSFHSHNFDRLLRGVREKVSRKTEKIPSHNFDQLLVAAMTTFNPFIA